MDFVPEPVILAQFALASVILTVTPGPDMTLFVGRSLSQGRAAGFACMLGAMCGIFVHTALVALGLSALIVAAPTAFFALKIAGAAYLVWLAIQAIRTGSAFSPQSVRPASERSLVSHWLTGLGINLLNPKIILFFMTFLPQFVSASDPHGAAKLFFLGGFFVVVSLPIVTPMILAADRFAALLKRNPAVTRALDWLFASIFSAFAVRILLTAER